MIVQWSFRTASYSSSFPSSAAGSTGAAVGSGAALGAAAASGICIAGSTRAPPTSPGAGAPGAAAAGAGGAAAPGAAAPSASGGASGAAAAELLPQLLMSTKQISGLVYKVYAFGLQVLQSLADIPSKTTSVTSRLLQDCFTSSLNASFTPVQAQDIQDGA